MIRKKGVFAMEYAVLVVVAVAALIVMAPYLKRALGGKWRQGGDSFGYGRQYEPGCTTVDGAGGGNCCGDHLCESFESYHTCPQDCPPDRVFCGDTGCDPPGETCSSCPSDCHDVCGDGCCNGSETCSSCPGDCGVCCGNTTCDAGETCLTCETDCHTCNDGCCSASYGETCFSCASDCHDVCGDGCCNGSETKASCSQDCVICGDDVCDSAYGETNCTCSHDCGPCFVQSTCNDNGTCEGFLGEDWMNCSFDCAEPSPKQGFPSGLPNTGFCDTLPFTIRLPCSVDIEVWKDGSKIDTAKIRLTTVGPWITESTRWTWTAVVDRAKFDLKFEWDGTGLSTGSYTFKFAFNQGGLCGSTGTFQTTNNDVCN